jgi:hypothetical protein
LKDPARGAPKRIQ